MVADALPRTGAIPKHTASASTGTDAVSSLTPDVVLIGVLIALCLFGTVMTFSASYAVGIRDYNDGLFFLKRDLISLAIGVSALVLASRVDYHFWRRFSVPAMVVTIGLLFVVLFTPAIGGAHRWFDLKNFQIQPSEVMKFVLVLYMADLLDRKGQRIRHFLNGAVPFAITLALIAFLVMLEPDLGTTTVLVAIGFAVFLVAGADSRQFALFVVTGVGGFLMLSLSADYRRQRLLSFLNPDRQDIRDAGWQLWQARIALGNGGVFGVGLGASRQKFSWLPAAHTDAIFAVVGEELGLIGCAFVLALFTLLAVRGYRSALRAPDRFGSVIATGITTWIVFQAVINIGGVTTAIPFTGVPLPFFSYGGSSLAVTLGALGVLINVSRQGVAFAMPRRGARQPAPMIGQWQPAAATAASATPSAKQRAHEAYDAADDPDNDTPPLRSQSQLPSQAPSWSESMPPETAPAVNERPKANQRARGGAVTRIPIPHADAASWNDMGTDEDAEADEMYAPVPSHRPVAVSRARPGQRDGQRHGGSGAIVTRLDPKGERDD